jgi:hypothetical protein
VVAVVVVTVADGVGIVVGELLPVGVTTAGPLGT